MGVSVLVAVLLGFLAAATLRAGRDGSLARAEMRAVFGLIALLLAWGAASSALALSGAYGSRAFLALLPGLWLSLVPFTLAGALAAASPSLRAALPKLFDATPLAWLTALQALRIAAVGTVAKAITGEFPVLFALAVGVPDMLFGVSAIVVAARVRNGAISSRVLLAWNLLGAAIIVPAAPVLIQMGLPGPLAIFREPPTTESVFVFPMVLAPSLTVPLFVAANLATAAALYWGRDR